MSQGQQTILGEFKLLSTENSSLILERSVENVDLKDLEGSTELYQSMSFESLLFSLLRIFKDKSLDITLKNNSLVVPTKSEHVLSKINNIIEVLCNISLTFEYDEADKSYKADFSHLSSEMDLLF